MPYKRHQPVDLREMEKTRWQGHHTICQFIRDIYHMVDDDEVKMKCRIAMNMAKSMHNKLKDYKENYGS
jgi:hypothetical protein